ncbi:MAG: DUF349 domain-containing protein [Psychroflexus halocasei]
MSDNTKPTENQEKDSQENSQETIQDQQANSPQEKSTEENTDVENEAEASLTEEKEDEHHKEIEDANAEESEDADNASRHQILMKDYEAMSIDELVLELNSLLKNEKVQNIRDHVNQIKIEFDKKFNEIVEEKKEEFIEEGGNVIDFHYSSPIKKKFYQTYFDYREKRDKYYSQLKKNLNENLKVRLGIIEELKNMIGSGESMSASFQEFKKIQERWQNAGSVPKADYSTLWNNYHHHVERFYDFLHLDREFRDLDFKHNLDQKLKLITRAEELADEEDINRAFRELQLLHKMWKEELGPVAREYREDIWQKFSEATKKIHDKRNQHFEELDKDREKNLDVKNDIIAQIQKIANKDVSSHNDAQQKIKNVEKLRELFFKSGKVPRKDNEATWDAFKTATREFNRKKNRFYKDLKKEQYENLKKKEELIKVAQEHKDSEDFKKTTPIMKKIQEDWKIIGHVPRKDSDKIWKEFKAACNHYFDKYHSQKKEENKEEFEAFNQKKDLVNDLKSLELEGSDEEKLKVIEQYIEKWNQLGFVPQHKRYIEGKFNRALDQIFKTVDISRKDAELMKYQNKLQDLDEATDTKKIKREESFLRKKIDETKSEINQLENNLQFFSTANKENPLVKDVYTKIEKRKEDLDMWKTKLDQIRKL